MSKHLIPQVSTFCYSVINCWRYMLFLYLKAMNMLWRAMLRVYYLFISLLFGTNTWRKISESSPSHLYVLHMLGDKQGTFKSVSIHALPFFELYGWGLTQSELQSSGIRPVLHCGQFFEGHLMNVTEAAAVIAETREEHGSMDQIMVKVAN